MSDNYEFEKAMQSQATDDYSPYVDKQSNGYINDINNGVYILCVFYCHSNLVWTNLVGHAT